MNLTKEIMWQAVRDCNTELDGQFFYGVNTTKIFCRPSCKSRTPKQENVDFFTTPESAIDMGFRPCKRCRPDLLGSPNMEEEQTIRKAQRILEDEFKLPISLENLAQQVGLSKYHFQRLFRKLMGSTPQTYLERVRMQKAQELLKNSELTVAEISMAVGYQSLPHFYALFRKYTNQSPKEYRNHTERG